MGRKKGKVGFSPLSLSLLPEKIAQQMFAQKMSPLTFLIPIHESSKREKDEEEGGRGGGAVNWLITRWDGQKIEEQRRRRPKKS